MNTRIPNSESDSFFQFELSISTLLEGDAVSDKQPKKQYPLTMRLSIAYLEE